MTPSQAGQTTRVIAREDGGTALLEGRALRHAWDDTTVLDGVDVLLPPGRIVAVVGPNGSGKSTLLGGLAGRLRLDAGEVRRRGAPSPVASRRHARAVHALLGDTAWLPGLTVLDHLMLLSAVGGPEARAACLEALARVGGDRLADRLPASLSSGQRQRAVLSTAWVRPWEVLLLDEPERHLDPESARMLPRWLRALAGTDRAILVATHAEEVRAVADSVLHLR